MASLKALVNKGKAPHYTFEVEVIAQHCTELPLPAGSRATFVLKRRNRLCVTDAEVVDAAGGVEWNTRCPQTATLFKQGDSWRPKEFTLKVQVARDKPRLGQEPTVTVAKTTLDFSQFCFPEPFGPKQLVVPLEPCGVLSISVRTQWLQHFNREADSLTDMSYLSLQQSVVTSIAGAKLTAEEQDLSGFDNGAAALQDGGVRGACQMQAAGGGAVPAGLASATKRRIPGALRLPRRGGSGGAGEGARNQQPPGALSARSSAPQDFEFGPVRASGSAGGGGVVIQRSATLPCLAVEHSTAVPAHSEGDSTGSHRRTPAPPRLVIPDLAAPHGGAAGDAATPTLLLPAARRQQQAGQQQQQQQQQQPSAVVGLAQDQWSPINLKEAVAHLYDSDEAPTPKATVLATVKRMFTGKARNATPPAPGSCTTRQLHDTFGTPQPSPPRVTPNPCDVATIDREMSVSALRRRCKQLLAERDEARAEGFAQAALAVEQSVEIDKLRRKGDMVLQRLSTTEERLLACFRDEAATDLIQDLAVAKVELAQRDFQLLHMQGEVRRRDAVVDKLRAQLTRMETKYRLQAASPGKEVPSRSPGFAADAPADSPLASQAGSNLRPQHLERAADGSPSVLSLCAAGAVAAEESCAHSGGALLRLIAV